MKTIIRKVLPLLLLLFSLLMCNLFENSNTVVIVRVKQSRSIKDFVNQFKLKVERDGIILLEETSSKGGFQLEITPGDDTTFTLYAMDTNGASLFIGSAEANVKKGEENIVTINLTNLSDQNTYDFSADYIENSGNTIYLTWDNSDTSIESYSIIINNGSPISIPQGDHSYSIDSGSRGEVFTFSLLTRDKEGKLERTVINGAIPWLIEYRLPDSSLIHSLEVYHDEALSITDIPNILDFKVGSWNNTGTDSVIVEGNITIKSNLIPTVYRYNFFVNEFSSTSLGTRESPYQTITEAINEVEGQSAELSRYRPVNILISGSYFEEEVLITGAGINLNGGWNSSFSSVTGVTDIGGKVTFNPNRFGISSIPSNTNGTIVVDYSTNWSIPSLGITSLAVGFGEGVVIETVSTVTLDSFFTYLHARYNMGFLNTTNGEIVGELLVGSTSLNTLTTPGQTSPPLGDLFFNFGSAQDVIAIVRWRYNKLTGNGVDTGWLNDLSILGDSY